LCDDPHQRICESTRRSGDASCARRYARARTPGDVRARTFEGLKEVDVLAADQGTKSTGPLIRLRRYAKICSVDMAVRIHIEIGSRK